MLFAVLRSMLQHMPWLEGHHLSTKFQLQHHEISLALLPCAMLQLISVVLVATVSFTSTLAVMRKKRYWSHVGQLSKPPYMWVSLQTDLDVTGFLTGPVVSAVSRLTIWFAAIGIADISLPGNWLNHYVIQPFQYCNSPSTNTKDSCPRPSTEKLSPDETLEL